MSDQSEQVTALELMRRGGTWLGAVRNRIKWMRCFGNGESVTWGSTDVLEPPLMIREIEELAAEAAAAVMNEASDILDAERAAHAEAKKEHLEVLDKLHTAKIAAGKLHTMYIRGECGRRAELDWLLEAFGYTGRMS
uniref:Uncharacterized protein n=1 Tax=viral metagenome TaxID=1070528 RepID=A0A6H1ZBW9_9ZZZZ